MDFAPEYLYERITGERKKIVQGNAAAHNETVGKAFSGLTGYYI
jgi:hypothetical protein